MRFCIIIIVIVLFSSLQQSSCENVINLSDVVVENTDAATSTTSDTDTLATAGEPFIPTNEWQVIKPGQAVPRGLHYRMNFQTGVQEAKLLDKEENTEKSLTNPPSLSTSSVSSPSSPSSSSSTSSSSCDDENETKNLYTKDGTSSKRSCPKKEPASAKGPKIVLSEPSKLEEHSDDKIYVTKDQLKDALNQFRDKVGTKPVDDVTWSNDAKAAWEEREELIKKKFRSIDEIRAELEDSMNLRVKTDVEVMKEYVHFITADNSTTDQKLTALDNLEYYVHQIDNALDLAKIGGLEPIVKLLNSTDEDAQERAANLLAAATQNNGGVKKLVLGYGGLRLLLQMLHREKKVSTKKKALYALSTLTRDNLEALHDLSKPINILSLLHVTKDTSLPNSLQVKAIDLLFHLVDEQNARRNRLESNGVSGVSGDDFNLDELLIEQGLCDILVPLLKSDDFYTKEKVLHAIQASVHVCADVFKREIEMNGLRVELDKLDESIQNEDDDDFKGYLEGMRKTFKEKVLDKLKS